ncbi:hypothetical protein KSP39_PZI006553 [Platanthera zijinensis]|uniref:ARC6 IMS domain-containing protein n=1 Tax=Platanthera zijinensis TaxID=2320716 RepID=A0AAP0BRD1_9ASPA
MPQPQSPGGVTFLARTIGLTKGLSPEPGSGFIRRDVAGRSALKVTEAQVVENGQIGGLVEIPLTCYQLLGLSEKAEKDEVVKAVMDLKGSDIEVGYTGDAIFSRQHLLMDIRDKLLFETEYAGNLKENVPPKSSVRILWAWLPGALSILQEMELFSLVIDVGQISLTRIMAKLNIDGILVAFVLSMCSLTKSNREMESFDQDFRLAARKRSILKSIVGEEKMPLLVLSIEESLEELAPACTLELLSLPRTSENAERRRGAIAALRELLRQGLDVETSCRVQDWNCFLSQALNKLMAAEIVDLLSWENLAITRKNKKLLESQNQRVVIDFDCFYLAMAAHLALGFSSKQMDLISRAKTICECLIASECVDLKLEEAFFSFLLGQGGEAVAFQKLQQLEINGCSSLQNTGADIPKTELRDKQVIYHSLELSGQGSALLYYVDSMGKSWVVGAVEGGFTVGEKEASATVATTDSSARTDLEEVLLQLQQLHGLLSRPPASVASASSISHKVVSVPTLEVISLPGEETWLNDAVLSVNPSNSLLKRNFNLEGSKFWENWSFTGDIVGRIAWTTFIGCVIIGVLKMLSIELGQPIISHMLHSAQSRTNSNARTWTFGRTPGTKSCSFIHTSIFRQLQNIMAVFKQNYRLAGRREIENPLLIDNLSSLTMASAVAGAATHRMQMPLEIAESLVKRWQDIKAEALGRDHRIHALSEILSESMLSKWQDLARAAREKANFWRFVLLKLSVFRADIVIDELGGEVAEVEAVIEEAAELINESQPRKPSYYSTYKVRYMLKRQKDGSWRFCGSAVDGPT